MNYADPASWNERYAKDASPYEWYTKWAEVKSIIREYVSHKSNVLHVGCGTSELGDHLSADGYRNVVNIDVSDVVIKSRTSSKHCTYQVGDVRHLEEFMNSEFEAVIDKGTVDSLLCSSRPTQDGSQALIEIYRVLKPGGIFLCFSHAPPSQRVGLFSRPALKWSVTYIEIPRTSPLPSTSTTRPPVFCYACKKSNL